MLHEKFELSSLSSAFSQENTHGCRQVQQVVQLETIRTYSRHIMVEKLEAI